MSLINQMLKDLERRSNRSVNTETILSNLQANNSTAALLANKIHWLPFIFVFLGLIFLFLTAHKIPHTVVAQPVNTGPSTPQTESRSFPSPGTLTGITLETKEGMTFLRLLLDKNVLYRINYEPKNNILILTLENTNFLTSLPSTDNSAIKNMRVTRGQNHSLTLMLALNSNVDIKDVTLSTSGKFSELQLNLLQNSLPTAHKISPLKKFTEDTFHEDKLQQIQSKASLLIKTGKLQKAQLLLEQAPPSFSDHLEYYALLAALYEQEGRASLAANLYQKLLTEQPENATWWVGLGVSLEGMGKNSEALIAFSRASQGENLDPALSTYINSKLSPFMGENSA